MQKPKGRFLVCCLKILHTDINIFHICNNTSCNKTLSVPSRAVIVECGPCKRKMFLRLVAMDINLSLQLKSKNGSIFNVTMFQQQLIELSGKEVIDEAKIQIVF